MKAKDISLLVAYVVLLTVGSIVIYSSSWYLAYISNRADFHYLMMHFMKIIVALLFFFVGFSIDTQVLRKYSVWIFISSILALALVLILPPPIAPVINGAKRWINLYFMKFQVSEMFKVGLILMLAFSSNLLKDRIGYFLVAIPVFVGIALIAIEPNISTAMLLAWIFLFIAFYAGASFVNLGFTIASLTSMALILINMFPHARLRFQQLLGSEFYQVKQSKVGLAHGGLLGVGLGEGKAKFLYLPEAHTDFVFSVIGEELGFVGAMIILMFVMFIILKGFSIAHKLHRKDEQLSILAFGIAITFAVYTLSHVSVVIGLFPPTGIPMPFISFGGSSLVSNSFLLGLLFQLSRKASSL